jgi:hypothetical protein
MFIKGTRYPTSGSMLRVTGPARGRRRAVALGIVILLLLGGVPLGLSPSGVPQPSPATSQLRPSPGSSTGVLASSSDPAAAAAIRHPAAGTLIQLTVSATPQKGAAPLLVNVVGTASGSPGATFITFNWTFDNTTSPYVESIGVFNGSNATSVTSHTYNRTGTYSLALKVSDNAGDTARSLALPIVATTKVHVDVTESVTSVTAGRPIVFTANVSGGLAPYALSWFNGSHVHPSNCVQAPLTFTCTPAQPKEPSILQTILVQVTDSANNVASGLVNYTVNQKLTGTVGFVTQYSCSGSSAVTFGTYTSTLRNGTPGYSYSWSFGDGASSSAENGTHLFAAGGQYIVTFTGVDASGSTVVQAYNVSSSYPACLQIAPPNYAPPLVFLETASGLLTGVVAVLALVLVRGLRTARPPTSPKPPVAGWSGPEHPAGAPTNAPPRGAQ